MTLSILKPHVLCVFKSVANLTIRRVIYLEDDCVDLQRVSEEIAFKLAPFLTSGEKPLDLSKEEENFTPFPPDHKFGRHGTLVYVRSKWNRCAIADGILARDDRLSATPYGMEKYVEDFKRVLSSCKKSIFAERPTGIIGPTGFLRLEVPKFIDGIYDVNWLLWSKEIMDDVRRVCGLDAVPVDVLRHQPPRDIVLVGVYGCGKTRTCYDICRSRFAIYLDWAHDHDLLKLRKSLSLLKFPTNLNDLDEVQSFIQKVSLMTMGIFIGRWTVLNLRNGSSDSWNPESFLQIQQLARSNGFDVFEKAFDRINRVPSDQIVAEFRRMVNWCLDKNVRIVMDEVHVLIETLPTWFHSSKSAEVDSGNKYVHPRSYLSFLARFLRTHGLICVWAGTHLRLGHISRISSNTAAAERPLVFTKFNYLTPKMVVDLLNKWVIINDADLKVDIGNVLQGRVGNFMMFVNFLGRRRDIPAIELNDDLLKKLFHGYVADTLYSYTNMWCRVSRMTLSEFAGDPDEPPIIASVWSLMEDLLFNAVMGDFKKLNYDPHWYRSLVSTGLVMIDDSRASICEPLVVQAAFKYQEEYTRNDIPASTIIHRHISMEVDEATRGKAIESICVVRIYQGFWRNKDMWKFFPDELVRIIRNEGIPQPRGLDDCRTGDREHLKKLEKSFLVRGPCNVVRPQSKLGSADIVYSYFTFHLKSRWTNVSGGDVIVSPKESEKNLASINKTWSRSDRMRRRANSLIPWVRILFEFPRNRKMQQRGEPHIITNNRRNQRTIIAGIDSEFTELFFGREFVDLVRRMTKRTYNTY